MKRFISIWRGFEDYLVRFLHFKNQKAETYKGEVTCLKLTQSISGRVNKEAVPSEGTIFWILQSTAFLLFTRFSNFFPLLLWSQKCLDIHLVSSIETNVFMIQLMKTKTLDNKNRFGLNSLKEKTGNCIDMYSECCNLS